MKRACLIAVALLLVGCVGAGGAPRPDFTPSQPKASGPPPYVINMWVLVCAAPEIQMQIDAPAEADPLGYWEARSGGALIRTNAPIIQRLGDPATVKVNVAEKPDPNAPAEVLFLLRCEGGRMASDRSSSQEAARHLSASALWIGCSQTARGGRVVIPGTGRERRRKRATAND